MSAFAVPARITVEACDEREATAKAQNLADAAERLSGRGYGLSVIGAPSPVSAAEPMALCGYCGRRVHDGEPCPGGPGEIA